MSIGIGRRATCGFWIACFLAVICSVPLCPGSSLAQDSPLRTAEPVSSVIADLRSYIPERMSEAGVPGVSVALIRNHEVVWTDGFGVSNRLTGEPVSSESTFETASISKTIAAYTALRLVEEGKLSLDKPVHIQLTKPWIPSSALSDRITLRHLLSHSSGLGDDPFFKSKRVAFEPGTGFLYSGMGAEYVKELIEQVTGSSLENAARKLVFDPLGMSASSFVNESRVMTHMANGHMRCAVLLIPFILVTLVTGLIALILNRAIRGSWRMSRQLKVVIGVLSLVIAGSLFYILLGKAFPNLVWVSIGCAIVFLCIMVLSYTIAQALIPRTPDLNQRKGLRSGIVLIWMLTSFVILAMAGNSVTIPVPKNHSSEISAIGSLRSTAKDLAAFLIELAASQNLSESTISQIHSAQTPIYEDFSWGLGIGIQHSKYGDAIWQNGITLAFRGIMVIYPKKGHGVVILTNSDSGLHVAYDIAAKALGGKARWEFF